MAHPPLDPDAAARVASFGVIPPMRERGLDAVRQSVEATPWPDVMPEMASIVDAAAVGDGGPIPLRIHRPHNGTGLPVLVYFHGGGMVMGSNRSFEPLARWLAAGTGAVVVADNADRLGVDASRLAVVGDSAGGTLAAAVALAARDRSGPQIFAQVLLYPGLDRDMAAPSILEMPNAPMLAHDDILYMHELADARAGQFPYRFPAEARDLTGLPQAVVVTAECDPIRDWGERYAARLRDSRAQVTVTRYPGIHHGFLMRSEATARGRLAMAEVCALLRAKFANPVRF